jgi:adenosylcobinamide kinase/adenosylcobinamide-phosphate guanylyltransferase
VLGGIRSGKSRWAELAIAEAVAPREPVRYLATGSVEGADRAWSQRVAAHQASRPPHWSTVETTDVATQLREFTSTATLIDDIGGWLTAVLDRHGAWEGADDGSVAPEIDQLLSAMLVFGSPLMVVSPEAGLTVVPATGSGRRFADELGELNQRLAELCDRVVLVVAGQPVTIKEPE